MNLTCCIILLLSVFFIVRSKLHSDEKTMSFGKSVSSCLKGICAILILIGHAPSPKPFHEASGFIVGLFFALSGYGLNKQYRLKSDFLKNFHLRIIKLCIPYFICIVLYLGLEHYLIGKLVLYEAVCSFINGSFGAILPHSWFVIAILYFYITFYISFKTKYKYIGLAISYFLWGILSHFVFYKDLMWGPSAAFVFGAVYCKYEMEILKSRYLNAIIIPFAFLLCVFPLKSVLMSVGPLFVILASTLSRYTPPKKNVLLFLGSISYEIYITQGISRLFVLKLHLISSFTYIVIWLMCTILLSYLLHILCKRIFIIARITK